MDETKVLHFLEVLRDEIGFDTLKEKVTNPLTGKKIAILVGPEGGIDGAEVEQAKNEGIACISLGKRILRTEDAAAFAIPIILSLTENL